MKLISLNIEGSKHFDRWLPFVVREDPEVLCLQEVYASDLDRIASELQMRYEYMPTLIINRYFDDVERHDMRDWGIALFYKSLPINTRLHYYTHDTTKVGELPLWNGRIGDIWKQAVIMSRFSNGITIACTHFAWSTHGESTDYQKSYMHDLIHTLHQEHPLVLCGDLNAPRGRATWAMLEEHYTDNIPRDVTTTLDPKLHKVPGLPYVVDALFTSTGVVARDVEVVSGVSDHQAIVGEVSLG